MLGGGIPFGGKGGAALAGDAAFGGGNGGKGMFGGIPVGGKGRGGPFPRMHVSCMKAE